MAVNMRAARECGQCAQCVAEYRFPECEGFVASPFKKHACSKCFHRPEEHLKAREKEVVVAKKKAKDFTEEVEHAANEINDFLGIDSSGANMSRGGGSSVVYVDEETEETAEGGKRGGQSREDKIASDSNMLSDFFFFDVGEHIKVYEGVARKGSPILVKKISDIAMDRVYYLPSGLTLKLRSGDPPKLMLADSKRIELPEEVLETLPRKKKEEVVVASEPSPREERSQPRRQFVPAKPSPPKEQEFHVMDYRHPERVRRRRNRAEHRREILADHKPHARPAALNADKLMAKSRERRKKNRNDRARGY